MTGPKQIDFKLSRNHFGPLWKYLCQDNITNVDWDSGQLWIKYANRIRTQITDPDIDADFIEKFSLLVANHESKPFNRMDYILSAETEQLRITFVHESFAVSGRSMSIRKSLPRLRFTVAEAVENQYCPLEALHLLVNCVWSDFNFVFCGEPGKGKTEAAKFFSSFIRPHEKVITVEDLREWHYRAINPNKDCIEFKVKTMEAYGEAIAVSLRLNPHWIMIAETRSREVRYLLESWSNGVNCMTTLHVDDVGKIPDRILNMLESRQDAERLVNQIYADVGIGILLKEQEQPDGSTVHKIWQACFYYREEEKNGRILFIEEGKFYPERIPRFIQKRIVEGSGQNDIFYNPQVKKRMQEEV